MDTFATNIQQIKKNSKQLQCSSMFHKNIFSYAYIFTSYNMRTLYMLQNSCAKCKTRGHAHTGTYQTLLNSFMLLKIFANSFFFSMDKFVSRSFCCCVLCISTTQVIKIKFVVLSQKPDCMVMLAFMQYIMHSIRCASSVDV